jgi:glutaredoxin
MRRIDKLGAIVHACAEPISGKWIMISARTLSIAFLAIACQPAFAQAYKWVDAQGRTHYGDRPPVDARAKPVATPISTYSGAPTLTAASKREDLAPQQQKPALVIYTTPTCGYCKAAKAHMNRRGIPYTEHDVTTSESYEREFRQRGGRGVPLIVAGDRMLAGYSAERMEELLKAVGY